MFDPVLVILLDTITAMNRGTDAGGRDVVPGLLTDDELERIDRIAEPLSQVPGTSSARWLRTSNGCGGSTA